MMRVSQSICFSESEPPLAALDAAALEAGLDAEEVSEGAPAAVGFANPAGIIAAGPGA